MTTADNKFVKILFRFYSNVLSEWTVETMWGEIVDVPNGLYKIANIPFYASVATDDIIYASYDETEQMLTYRETVTYSGNSIVQVVRMDNTIDTNSIREIFNSLGYKSEKLNEGYFVIEIPADKSYTPAQKQLSALQNKGIIDYAEPVLSTQHQY